MAEAVAAALNKGFEKQRKGRDRKPNTPVEVTPPQNPVKHPKIQTKALMTPKGKSQLKFGEIGGGSGDVLTRSRLDLGIPKDILKLPPSQPDGVYPALAARMAEDGDWADGLWNIRWRLVLVTIYRARDLGRSEGKVPPRNHILDAVTFRNTLR